MPRVVSTVKAEGGRGSGPVICDWAPPRSINATLSAPRPLHFVPGHGNHSVAMYINNSLCKDYMPSVSKLCTQSTPHSRGQRPPLRVATFLSSFHKHCVRPLLPPNNARKPGEREDWDDTASVYSK